MRDVLICGDFINEIATRVFVEQGEGQANRCSWHSSVRLCAEKTRIHFTDQTTIPDRIQRIIHKPLQSLVTPFRGTAACGRNPNRVHPRDRDEMRFPLLPSDVSMLMGDQRYLDQQR